MQHKNVHFFDKQCTIIIFTGHYLDLRIALDKCSSQSCYTSAHRKTSMKNTLFLLVQINAVQRPRYIFISLISQYFDTLS